MSVLSDIVAKFRAGSPNIAKAFDEVERRLVAVEDSVSRAWTELAEHETRLAALEGTTEPPPPPPPPTGTFPPVYADWSDTFSPAPSSRWSWEFAGSQQGFPNPGAALVDDGSGGKAVRLTSPVVGGNGQLSAFYDGSGQWGKNGMRQLGQIEFRLVSHSSFIWIWEWHETQNWQDINSCAIGVNQDRSMRVQISGGQVSGHQYSQIPVPVTLQLNRFYRMEWDITWSPDPAVGRFGLKLDGQQIVNQQRGTLLASGTSTDTVVIGGYSYTPPGSSGTNVVDFRRFAVGV